jgi:hypothetical protein
VFLACCGFGVERTLHDLPPLAQLPQLSAEKKRNSLVFQ